MVKYDIAFSYASEQKSIVDEFKIKLQELGLKVFVDSDHPERLVFKHVANVLKPIYEDEDVAMIIFLSEDYARKNFTMYESWIAFDRLLNGQKLEIIRIDDAVLSWLPNSIHHFDIRKNDTDFICDAIYCAIKGSTLQNAAELFVVLSDYITQNCTNLEIISSSEKCNIFKLIRKENAYIKIIYSEKESCISIFHYSSYIESLFTIGEIYINERKFTFINKGIFESAPVSVEFSNNIKLMEYIVKAVCCFEELL